MDFLKYFSLFFNLIPRAILKTSLQSFVFLSYQEESLRTIFTTFAICSQRRHLNIRDYELNYIKDKFYVYCSTCVHYTYRLNGTVQINWTLRDYIFVPIKISARPAKTMHTWTEVIPTVVADGSNAHHLWPVVSSVIIRYLFTELDARLSWPGSLRRLGDQLQIRVTYMVAQQLNDYAIAESYANCMVIDRHSKQMALF